MDVGLERRFVEFGGVVLEFLQNSGKLEGSGC